MGNKKYAISLGGSILCPDKINIKFLKNFCLTIKQEINKGAKFAIIVGGGKISRRYQQVADLAGNISDKNKDWIGIYSTRLNARLVGAVLESYDISVLFQDSFNVKNFGKYSVIIGGGSKPGHSTDFVAIKIASKLKIKEVINLSKPKYVYTADPAKNKNAKIIKRLNWQEYLKIIPAKWSPGLNTPFDPIASKLAKINNISVIIANGLDVKNLKNILSSKTFKGTVISENLKQWKNI